MPFGDEAKEFTRQLVDQKIVRIKLLRKDQYSRVVAKVTIKGFLPFTKKDVTLELAERGLATLYTGGGAEYDVCRRATLVGESYRLYVLTNNCSLTHFLRSCALIP